MTESSAPAAPAPGSSRDALAATTGPRGAGLSALRPLSMLFLLLGVVQIFLAGYGVFDLHGQKLGSPGETAFNPHRMVGAIMMAVALLIVIAALLARPNRTIVLEAVGLLVIVAVLQSALASAGQNQAFWGGFHALFGVGSLGLASVILAQARRFKDGAAGWGGGPERAAER